MAEQFPDGYDCGAECELNRLATWAADHKALFEGVANPGIEATTVGVEGITGLKINYYAMVNMEGFQQAGHRDGRGDAQRPRPDPDRRHRRPVTGYIEPGMRKLNGFETLWFARSRVGRRRLLADGAAEVRDERDAAAAQPADRGDEVRGDRQGQRGADHHRPAPVRARPVHGAGAEGPQPADAHGLVRAADDPTGDPDIDKIHAAVRARRSTGSEGKTATRRRRRSRSQTRARPEQHRPRPAARSAASARATPPTRPRTSPRSAERARSAGPIVGPDCRSVGSPAMPEPSSVPPDRRRRRHLEPS